VSFTGATEADADGVGEALDVDLTELQVRWAAWLNR
jgi:hypothetical protein